MKNKKYILWAIRILISILFLVSGIAKLFPVWAFEKQLVDLGITSWCYAPYLARFIIALELSITVAILQPHYIKIIVIPGTILLLLAFCVHLSIEMYMHGAMSGNCGCFGQLIPMTPLEAFIKNIITIGLLIYLYKIVGGKEKGQNRFFYLIFIYIASALALFVFFPFCPCKATTIDNQPEVIMDSITQPSATDDSTLHVTTSATDQQVKNNSNTKDIVPIKPNVTVSPKNKTRYSQYTKFGNETVNLDEGKKTICFFSVGCDDCRNAARDLCLLSQKIDIPPVYIFFMNEETEQIQDFFKEATCSFPYTILEVPVFWQLLGTSADTPGIILLNNGNTIRYYEGLENNKFNVGDFESACKSI